MNRMIRKVQDNKGFTLAELLIVVAIIAVLVAVSIPIFTAKLEKSRESTDLANLRAAKAAAVSSYLAGEKVGTLKYGKDVITVYYDADKGVLTETKPTVGYGKGTAEVGDATNTSLGYTPDTECTDLVIKVVVAKNGEVTLSWE